MLTLFWLALAITYMSVGGVVWLWPDFLFGPELPVGDELQ